MGEGEQNSFVSFWKRSKESSQTVKFMPTVTPTTKGDSEKAKPIKKEISDRRSQVRRAQNKHRQRKENYQRHLEQDISNLRDLLTAVMNEEASLQAENNAMKGILSSARIAFSLDDQSTTVGSDSNSTSQHLSVHSHYDDALMANCLHTTSSHSSHDSYHTASNPQQSTSNGIADVALNFILALEHPCRTHFSPNTFQSAEADFADSGHVLMCSTLMYSSAPPPVFDFATESQKSSKAASSRATTADDSPSWLASSVGVDNLYQLSQSLDLHVDEITPVQAWFQLQQRLGDDQTLDQANIESLKREVGGLVKCFGFGAVVDKLEFWRAVERVLGPGWSYNTA